MSAYSGGRDPLTVGITGAGLSLTWR